MLWVTRETELVTKLRVVIKRRYSFHIIPNYKTNPNRTNIFAAYRMFLIVKKLNLVV